MEAGVWERAYARAPCRDVERMQNNAVLFPGKIVGLQLPAMQITCNEWVYFDFSTSYQPPAPVLGTR